MVQSIVSAWNQIVTAAQNEEVQRAPPTLGYLSPIDFEMEAGVA